MTQSFVIHLNSLHNAYATSQLRRGKRGKVGGILNLILIDNVLPYRVFKELTNCSLEIESFQYRTEEHVEMAPPSPQ